MSTIKTDPDGIGTDVLSIALIGPETERRERLGRTIAEQHACVTQQFPSYPVLDDVPRLLDANYDAIVVELDSDPEHALELVETLCADTRATVMVYSWRADADTLVRCMRSGAREFLTEPFDPAAVAEALVRASVRRASQPAEKRLAGKMFVFLGSKGGAGVTTIASNFAISVAQEAAASTLLIDLNYPIGDAALSLGIVSQYTVNNALEKYQCLDFNFLSRLLMKHRSGLSVLAAPDRLRAESFPEEAVERLLHVARQNFDYVIVDAGSHFAWPLKTLMEGVSGVYLVTQVGVSELRNANCIINEVERGHRVQVEVVLNRFVPHALGIDEDSIRKALTRPAQWKIPSDYQTAQTAQNTATPLALKDSQIARMVRQMGRVAAGMSAVPEKKKRFGIFG